MKKLNILGGGYSEYSAPSVTALEVAVEKGFAASSEFDLFGDGTLPGLETGDGF